MLYQLSYMQHIARRNHFAIPHFLGCNLEMTLGAIRAAERLAAPIAFGVAPEVFSHFPLAYLFPMLLNIAAQTKMPAAIQLEHGSGYEQAAKAISLGVNSIMYDGSALSYAENVANTCEIVRMAHAFNVCVEAELGHVGGSAIRTATDPAEGYKTDPDLVLDFISKTNVDTLAISFGNVHGLYRGKPRIDTDLVRRIAAMTDVPLVMHGGSGLPDEIYPKIVEAGISNIHFYSGVSMYAWGYLTEKVCDLEYPPYHEISAHLVDFFDKKTEHIIKLLGVEGHAGDF